MSASVLDLCPSAMVPVAFPRCSRTTRALRQRERRSRKNGLSGSCWGHPRRIRVALCAPLAGRQGPRLVSRARQPVAPVSPHALMACCVAQPSLALCGQILPHVDRGYWKLT
eukprot:scaffold45373_cov208-Isochrysis_galbana.AAC.1